MATNIDKTLYPASGEFMGGTEPDDTVLEIEVTDEDLAEAEETGVSEEMDFGLNLAETMDDDTLQSLASTLASDIENDRNSRKDWEQTYIDGLKLMGLKPEERSEPWIGACGVVHPMITEAVMRFQAETIMETFPAQGPVTTKIIGEETPENRAAATRVKEDMNNELTERMVEYRPEHEKMLWNLPATGSAFKKVYFDPSLGRQVSLFVPADDVLIPYGTSDMSTCYRVTHVMRKTKNELRKLQAAGFYVDVELPEPEKTKDDIQQAKDKETGFSDINDDRYVIFEAHVDLDLKGHEDMALDPETGEMAPSKIALPYVVTMIRGTNTILGIRRNWVESEPLKLKRQHFVHYQYVPGFGAYGFGLFHLIGGYAKSATAITRQLVDAGTLANLPGGLKTRGLRIKGDDTPISPGEFRDVDVSSGTIRDNILPLPYKEPSNTLYQLLGNIVEEGRRFAATSDVKVTDMSSQAPVGTTLALLERQLKPLTAVQARVHYAMKQELKLLKDIIRDHTPAEYDYIPDGGKPRAKRSDYERVDVIPVSDPNAATMSQRIVQYQAVIQMAQMAPDIYDLPVLHRGMLDVLGIKHADKLVPLPTDMKPQDPVTENMRLLKTEPVKAFVYQDHESHIKVHMALMQDPMIQQMVGQSPQAAQIGGAIMAHVIEHVGFSYRQKVEAQLGLSLPPVETELPPEAEVAVSAMMAQAAGQVLQQSQTAAAAQQAQQAAQDPVLQIQQGELEVKKGELQIKDKEADAKIRKILADIMLEREKLEIEREKLESDSLHKGFAAGAQAHAAREQVRLAEEKQHTDAHAAGLKIGADIGKTKHTTAAAQEKAKSRPKAAKKPKE
jgi:hypothetical protein